MAKDFRKVKQRCKVDWKNYVLPNLNKSRIQTINIIRYQWVYEIMVLKPLLDCYKLIERNQLNFPYSLLQLRESTWDAVKLYSSLYGVLGPLVCQLTSPPFFISNYVFWPLSQQWANHFVPNDAYLWQLSSPELRTFDPTDKIRLLKVSYPRSSNSSFLFYTSSIYSESFKSKNKLYRIIKNTNNGEVWNT